MSFLEFQNTFAFLPVIPVVEIEKRFPGFDPNALTRWQKKGYLEKIRNGFYRLTSQSILGDENLFFIANRIYQPSYISLQSALRWYDFISEGVFTTTSVTTRKTQTFVSPKGDFFYRKIRRELFFGYRLENIGGYRFKIADPAKTILDLLYHQPALENEDDFFELRLNIFELRDKLNMEKLDIYLPLFSSKTLERRIEKFKAFLLNNDDTY